MYLQIMSRSSDFFTIVSNLGFATRRRRGGALLIRS
jgi:hypothetical protein